MNRVFNLRHLACLVMAWLLALCSIDTAGAVAVEKPLRPITTTGGTVVGLALPSGVKAWFGVPFAEPPTGAQRWRPPQSIHWSGVWNADRKMPECPQVLRAHDINHYYGEEATSEDCLYLNIWAPPASSVARGKLPVIVYLYGGGFTIGSGGIATYGGEALAQRSAVFVNFNYRLGVLGFLSHPELSKEQDGHSGNYGLLDQALALRWIHDNIAQFGGDPARILIIGQSAGAASVTFQLASPLSRGLFSRAMMSSGCNWTTDVATLAEGERVGLAMQKYFGAASLAELRNVPADRFVAAQLESQIGVSVTSGVRAGPVVDGYFLVAPPREVLEAGKMSAVPIIASFNKDESFSPLMTARTIAEYESVSQRMYGADTAAFLSLYPVTNAQDIRTVGGQVAREGTLEDSARTCAQLQTRFNRSKAYVSLFSARPEFTPGVHIADYDVATTGAYHTADIPFWFGNLDAFNMLRPTRAWTESDRKLSGSMMDALVAFAATGDPSTPAVSWPAWSSDREVKVEWGGGKALAAVVPINVAGIEWLKAHPARRLSPAGEVGARGGPRD
jgi:para-nitrobenzyl esterase